MMEKRVQKPDRTLHKAYNVIKHKLPKKYDLLVKICARLLDVKDLHSWRRFLYEIRRTHTKKVGESIKNFLEIFLEELIKMGNGVQQKRLIGGFWDILMFTLLRNVRVCPNTWTVQILSTFSITRHFRCNIPGLVLFPFLHFTENDEQQYSAIEIIFQQAGILNNIFVYNSPFKKRQKWMYIVFWEWITLF